MTALGFNYAKQLNIVENLDVYTKNTFVKTG